MRRPRMSDELPASQLLRRGADPWQTAHAILFLYQQLAGRRRLTVRQAFSELGSVLHAFVHVQDLHLAGWKGILIHDLELLEGKLNGAVGGAASRVRRGSNARRDRVAARPGRTQRLAEVA